MDSLLKIFTVFPSDKVGKDREQVDFLDVPRFHSVRLPISFFCCTYNCESMVGKTRFFSGFSIYFQ